jgi:integrase
MPKQQRFKTKYPGVYYIEGTATDGKPERIYYIVYRKNGKLIEEKAGRQYQDDMTPARAANKRTQKIEGSQLTNEERREAEKTVNERWTIDRLWEEYKTGNPGLKGIVTDENRYTKHIKTLLGEREPKELVPLDVDRLRLKMLKTHKPATVRNALELLRRIVNYGVKKQLSEGLSFTIQMPEVYNEKTEDLTPEQLSRLLEAMDEDSNIHAANFMRMALFTGMRRGELFKLKWNDIDLERGFIAIKDPKGGPDQKVPLNDAARQLLDIHPRTEGSLFVFPGRAGGQRTDIKKSVNRIKERAGLPKDFRACHGLRHVYATMLASSGQVDMYTLQKLLTHKSPAMTQRYAHLRDEALKNASNLAGNIITRAMNGKCEEATNAATISIERNR